MNKATISRILLAVLLLTGLTFAQVDSLVYEVVQTNPPLGTPPTANDGFCSTSGGVLGCTNVQRYVRLDPLNLGSENIVGLWLSAGNDVAPLLRQFGIDSIYATFVDNSTYAVLSIDVNGTETAFAGTYTTAASGVGNINTIVLNQLAPTTLTSEGIFEITNYATGIDDDGQLPVEFSLEQNYPNPFNPSTRIAFELPTAATVKLTVFNLAGQEVAKLVNEQRNAGRHEITFEAGNLPSGIYFYRIQAGNYISTRKMMLVR